MILVNETRIHRGTWKRSSSEITSWKDYEVTARVNENIIGPGRQGRRYGRLLPAAPPLTVAPPLSDI